MRITGITVWRLALPLARPCFLSGGSVLAHLARAISAVNPASGRGARNAEGHLSVPDAPGPGAASDLDRLGEPDVRYT